MKRNLKKRIKKTTLQIKIEVELMKAGLTKSDISDYYGHKPSNVSNHYSRQNEKYFMDAIEGIKREQRLASAG